MTESWQKLEAHEKKVALIEWHPTAEFILASGGIEDISNFFSHCAQNFFSY